MPRQTKTDEIINKLQALMTSIKFAPTKQDEAQADPHANARDVAETIKAIKQGYDADPNFRQKKEQTRIKFLEALLTQQQFRSRDSRAARQSPIRSTAELRTQNETDYRHATEIGEAGIRQLQQSGPEGQQRLAYLNRIKEEQSPHPAYIRALEREQQKIQALQQPQRRHSFSNLPSSGTAATTQLNIFHYYIYLQKIALNNAYSVATKRNASLFVKSQARNAGTFSGIASGMRLGSGKVAAASIVSQVAKQGLSYIPIVGTFLGAGLEIAETAVTSKVAKGIAALDPSDELQQTIYKISQKGSARSYQLAAISELMRDSSGLIAIIEDFNAVKTRVDALHILISDMLPNERDLVAIPGRDYESKLLRYYHSQMSRKSEDEFYDILCAFFELCKLHDDLLMKLRLSFTYALVMLQELLQINYNYYLSDKLGSTIGTVCNMLEFYRSKGHCASCPRNPETFKITKKKRKVVNCSDCPLAPQTNYSKYDDTLKLIDTRAFGEEISKFF